MFRACAIVILGLTIYFLTLAAIGFLDEAYAGIVKMPDDVSERAQYDETIKVLKAIGEKEPVKQGLSWLLTTFAALAATVLSKKEEGDEFRDQVEERTEPGKGTSQFVTEAQYVNRLMAKLRQAKENFQAVESQHQRTVQELYAVKKFARRRFRLSTMFLVAFCFAFAHVAAAGTQAWVNAYRLYDTLPEPLRFFTLFSQSTILLLFAAAIPFLFYRKYLQKVRKAELASMFVVGWLGVFVAGFMGFVQQGPEVYSLMLGHSDVEQVPYFGVHFLAYLMVTKLFVFPTVGLASCALAGMRLPA